MTTFNSEWVGFINSRLKEDLVVTKQLAECRTAQDVYSVYNGFFQTAMEQYQGEFGKMSQIGQTMADNTMHSVQDSITDLSKSVKAA